MKKTTIWALIIGIIIILVGAYLLTRGPVINLSNSSGEATTTTATSSDQTTAKPTDKEKTVIGQSVGGKDITAYHYGTGKTELLFIGGIHGGYEWNTALVAYQLMDYLAANPSLILGDLKVTVIPALNPDGLNKVVGTTGRFASSDVSTDKNLVVASRLNDNKVDLNRNFDCGWQSSAVWQKTKVSGGSQAFSEPESQALKAYIETNNPKAVVVWYSQAGGVFASRCDNGILPETKTLAKTFADASGYKSYESFDFYETTGDAVNWLAKKGIPAISVILTTHDDTEWSKNQAGVLALIKSYSK
jgi:hypothetical protein